MNLALVKTSRSISGTHLIRQMLLEGLLKKDIEEYGVLKITKKGEEFLKKPKSFKIVLNNLYEEANADDEEGAEAAEGAARMKSCLKC